MTRSKMQHTEIKNKDHNYSEVKLHNLQHIGSNIQNAYDNDIRTTYKSNKSGIISNKEVFGQIKNINELKRITPCKIIDS